MSDYISRADVFEIIDKAFSQPMRNGVTLYADICLMLNALPTHANSRSTHERDYISRADAIEAVCGKCSTETRMECALNGYFCCDRRELEALPSADADGEDLIIKGAKGIQDGLYNIKDGKLFKYKAKGGTVRTYPIVPSVDAVSREEYEETDGVVKIEKQNANEVGEIKHIVIHSPNYTRYFYNESMPLPSADAVYGKWLPIEETIPTYDGGEKTWLTGMKCSNCGKLFDLRVGYYFCPSCGARMYKGGEPE